MDKKKQFARLVVELPLNQAFDYNVPSALQDNVEIGSRVWVPFGNKKVTGYIVGFSEISEYPKTKDIIALVEERPLLNQNLIKMAYFISEYYCCPIGLVFKCMVPKAVRKITRREKSAYYVENLLTQQKLINAINLLHTKYIKQKEILKKLQGYKRNVPVPAKDLFESGTVHIGILKTLEKKEWIKIHKRLVDFEEEDDIYIPTKPFTLTEEQTSAMQVLLDEAQKHTFSPVLLHGVTGSGKTEIYLQVIEYMLKNKRQAIVIVPEISLTPQTIERFKSRFGKAVAVLHSRLSDGERYYNWKKIKEGKAQIAVGPRSAIFAPFTDVGVIVVDEEHERSYKQEESPKYHARDIAMIRAKYENALCILGSATPCLESYYNALSNKYTLIELTKRIDHCLMPRIVVVDMKREIQENPKGGLFSHQLLNDIGVRLDKGEQVMLFLNRRGYSRVLLCVDCGHVCECKQCSIALTHHKRDNRLLCHICGYSRTVPYVCPECKSSHLKFSGFGTQKIELALSAIFPQARIGRMDADTTVQKGAHQRILDEFKTGKTDILIGTQMIAKGLDFPNVTLVGVISADLSLHIPDFRAAENTFQLLTQVSGRAGRGDIPGVVIIQTFTPEHMAIKAAVQGNYKHFFEQELAYRKELHYPPLTRCINITISGEGEEETRKLAEHFSASLRYESVPVLKLGPVPAPIYKVKNKFRWQILLKGKMRSQMEQVIKHALKQIKNKDINRIVIDVDPLSMM